MTRIKTTITSLLIAGIGFSNLAQAEVNKREYFSDNKNVEIAMNAISAGELEKAQKFFKKASKANLSRNQMAMLYNNLCAVDYNLEQYEEALKSCNKSLLNNNRDWRAFVNRANAYAALNQPEMAEKDYKKAISLKPESEMAKRAFEIFKTSK